MADSTIAIQKTLIHEGGYVDDPNDSGGPTSMGITQKDMPGKNLKELTVDEAVAYYKENYWKPYFSQISDQLIANKIFDMSVLFGVGSAVEVLQAVLQVPIDGVFGPGTLGATNASEPVSLLAAYQTRLVTHALAIIARNPVDKEFFAGWVRRINS